MKSGPRRAIIKAMADLIRLEGIRDDGMSLEEFRLRHADLTLFDDPPPLWRRFLDRLRAKRRLPED